MTFSDDDLKRLKESIIDLPSDDWDSVATIGDIKALLARLEAAEKAFEAANEWIAHDGAIAQNKAYIEAYEAWRKAAGK